MNKILSAIAVAIGFALAANAQTETPREWRLGDCIKYAQENSIDVQRSRLQYENSQSALKTYQVSMTPSVNASVGQNISFGRATGLDNVIVNRSQASTSFGVNASMPLFTGFRITNQIKSGKLNLQSALADIENVQENVALNIAAQYLQVLYNQELVKISREQYNQSVELVERTQTLVEQGKVSESELYDNRAQMMQYAQSLTQSENSYSLSKVDLCQMMNFPDVENFMLADVANDVNTLIDQGVIILSPDDVYAYSIDNHPMLKSMGLRVQSAKSDIKIAKSGYYPSLSLSGGYSTGYYHLFNATNSSFGEQLGLNGSEVISLNLSIPIYNRLTVREQVRQSKIAANIRELELINSQQTIFKSIQTAYYNAKASKDKLSAAEQSEEAGKMAFEFEKQKYENGASTSYDYNQAQIRWRNSQMEVVQAKYELILRSKILDFYMGREITL